MNIGKYTQTTAKSPDIKNEMLEIVVQCSLDCNLNEIRLGYYYGFIVYETSDMSKISETPKSILFGKNSFQSQSSTLKSYYRIF